MKPTREQIEIIILDMMRQETIIDKIADVVNIMAPDTYPPIITCFNPMKTMQVLHPEIYCCISYWWYDADCLTDKIGKITNVEGETLEIQARSLASLKKYLEREGLLSS